MKKIAEQDHKSINTDLKHIESKLSNDDKEIRSKLIDDAKNLLIALGFEPILEADRFKSKHGSLWGIEMMAYLIGGAFNPKPYDKITISKEGPKNESMHVVLKSAIDALEKLDPNILGDAVKRHAGQYDLVTTKFRGQQNLSSFYGMFAQKMGTITNQPGNHVVLLLEKVNAFFDKLKHLFKPSLHK